MSQIDVFQKLKRSEQRECAKYREYKMKKILFIVTLLLMFSMSAYAEYKKENWDKLYANRIKILKANNFVGYKGKTNIGKLFYK